MTQVKLNYRKISSTWTHHTGMHARTHASTRARAHTHTSIFTTAVCYNSEVFKCK